MQVKDSVLRAVAELAQQQVIQEELVTVLKVRLETAAKALAYTAEILLPNAMLEAGLSEFRLTTGEFIEVKRDIYASISEANFGAAKAWLVDNNLDGIVKHTVTLSFAKGEGGRAVEALTLLVDNAFVPVDKEAIHPQTLKAFVREQLQKGADLPMDVFGVHEVVKTKVSLN